MKLKTVLLLSGGLDSVVLAYDLVGQGEEVYPVLFDYKQRHVQELQFAKAHCKRLNLLFHTVEIPMLAGSELTDGRGASVVVPFRNPILLSIAVNFAVDIGAQSVAIGCNKDDQEHFPDCRWPVMDALNHAIKLSGYSVQIRAPYIERPKWWIARFGSDLGVQLSDTWSCYKGGAQPCGECEACKKRETALKHNENP